MHKFGVPKPMVPQLANTIMEPIKHTIDYVYMMLLEYRRCINEADFFLVLFISGISETLEKVSVLTTFA